MSAPTCYLMTMFPPLNWTGVGHPPEGAGCSPTRLEPWMSIPKKSGLFTVVQVDLRPPVHTDAVSAPIPAGIISTSAVSLIREVPYNQSPV